jgi:hypothetical protein
MVHLTTLIVTTDSERLTYGGFSHGETIRFGSLEFIANCFGSLSLSPMGSGSGAIFVGMACSLSPSLRTILEDSTDKFFIVSSREGSSSLPIFHRHSMGAPPAPITTTPCSEDASAP